MSHRKEERRRKKRERKEGREGGRQEERGGGREGREGKELKAHPGAGAGPRTGETSMIRQKLPSCSCDLSGIMCCTCQPTVAFQDWTSCKSTFRTVLICVEITEKSMSDRTLFSFLTLVVFLTLQKTCVLCIFRPCFFNTCLDFSPAEPCSTIHLPPRS